MSDHDALPPRTGSTRPQQKAPDSGDAANRKGPSLARRIISWIFILLLVLLVVFEWRAKSNYNGTLDALKAGKEEREKADGEMKLAEAEPLIKGSPQRTASALRDDQVVEYRWKSFFRTYVLYLVIEKGSDVVMHFQTDQPD